MIKARFIDLVALVLVAVAVLMPPPLIEVHPAIEADKADLDRLSALQDAHFRSPGDVDIAVELARVLLEVDHPQWALETLDPFLGSANANYRVHQVAAYSWATLLLPKRALAEAEAGLRACDAAGAACPQTARIKLSYLADLMRAPAAAGVDPRTDPKTAHRMVMEALRATTAPPVPQK